MKTVSASENGDGERLAEVFREVAFRGGEVYGIHHHHRIEINYVKRGSCTLSAAGQKTDFRRGDLMVVPSELNHIFEAGPRGATLIQLEFMPEVIASIIPSLPSAFNFLEMERRPMAIKGDVRIHAILRHIILELSEQDESYREMVMASYCQLLILLMRESRRQSAASPSATYPPILVEMLKSIGSRRLDSLSVEAVAADAGVTPRYVRKLFHQHLGIAPLAYIARLRIAKATELLSTTDLSSKEIALECGFSSVRQFAQTFRRLTGLSPDRYNREARVPKQV